MRVASREVLPSAAASDVVPRCRVVLAAVKDDGVQRAVELTAAAAAEPVPDRLAARGGMWCDAGKGGRRLPPSGLDRGATR
jgi:hypothetical protein